MDLLKLDIWEVAEACGVCGSSAYIESFSVNQKRFVQCMECHTTRLYDRIQESQLGYLYDNYYSDDNLSEQQLNEQLANPTFAFRRQRLERFVPNEHRSLFEIGCGDGNFLATLKARGWQVDGLEYSANIAALVKARHKIAIQAGNLLEMPLAPASFNTIAAYHVFEHLYHPIQWLQKVRTLLKPGGILHLQLPNFGGLDAHLTQGAWEGLAFPQHVYLYSPSMLNQLLIGEGFKPLSTVTYDPWHSPTYTFISYLSLVKSILKRGSLPRSETDSCCATDFAPASPSASPLLDRAHPLRKLAIDSAMALSAVVARAESWLGLGNMIDIVATAV